MAQPIKVPNALRHWQCTFCSVSNPLFDTRCTTCCRFQEFNAKAKLQLIELCQTYCDDSSSWNKISNDGFKIEPLTKALSNKLYKIEVIDAYQHKLSNISRYKYGVLRIFNHRIGLSIDQLLSVYKSFADSEIGTGIFGTFDIGQIEEWIDGHLLNDNKLLNNNGLSLKVANILSKIHELHPPSFNPLQNEMIPKLRSNIAVVSSIFDQQISNHSQLQEWLFVLKHTNNKVLNGKVFGDIIEKELEALIQIIEGQKSLCSDLVFCHNDYHSANMILQSSDTKTDDVDSDDVILKIIDYEYCGYNYRSFDFGNFFNELMIDNYFKDPPYFTIHPVNYPSKEYRKTFLSEYLKDLTVDHEDKEIECMLQEIEYGSMLSHLWWSMWGIIESQRTDIDWDYVEYARQRLCHFFRLKQTFTQDAVVFSKL